MTTELLPVDDVHVRRGVRNASVGSMSTSRRCRHRRWMPWRTTRTAHDKRAESCLFFVVTTRAGTRWRCRRQPWMRQEKGRVG